MLPKRLVFFLFAKVLQQSVPAHSKGYTCTTSVLRNIQKDWIIPLCLECVLSYLIWVFYIYIKNPRLFSLFSQLYPNFWQFLYHSSCLFSYPFILVRFFEIPMFFKFGHVIRYISFSFIPLRKGATIDTYSSIKRTHFTLCAFTINFSSFVTTKFENLHSWRGELTSTSCHWFRSALLCHTGNLWFMARTLSQSWISCHN